MNSIKNTILKFILKNEDFTFLSKRKIILDNIINLFEIFLI